MPTFLLLLALLLAACSGNADDTLNGLWRCDGKATLALQAESRGMTEERLLAGALVLDAVSMFVDTEKKTLSLTLGDQKEQYAYTLRTEGKDVYVLDLGDSSRRLEMTDKDTLRMTDSRAPDRVTIFVRVE
jgi:hypothetical protein